ncbi:16S rRNA (adenine(1518)-N(6)/adenine(1519)-N(6))-dimethyltransferase RsmA [Candidatus Erwinia haradaeae]|uniref:Ribosomal RNA small subunit methyltransferase A n=1 Tax=Candidatus Erwinia haradaeae TaxID=1922217 RepID=A0A451D1N0_9GAMM|nr:16S rRNA (adenine(1518)-N(6)/adenine(1519)-N(6))-dimethyltransferase RsmA [Candidatus Erwinia haradaeae]VFP79526.1 Ribosomal RNA small subunit methyltransferase A [Candidatus Erwinia haradaeae]
MITHLYKGHYVRKRFGQHFLHDQYVIDSIINAINPKNDEIIIEIGPGLGALTKKIGKLLNHLSVIEIDHDLSLRLKNNSSLHKKLCIFQQDVLTFDFSWFSNQKKQLLRVFGNPPYNISTPLIFHLFHHINSIHDIHLMLQEEVVDRLLANPGSKSYSRLSVVAQYYCKISQILTVSSQSFIPQPNVRSKLVRLIPITQTKESLHYVHFLSFVTKEAFSQRRKKIRNSLSHLFPSEILLKMNICPNLRAENITISQYHQLANWLSRNLNIPKHSLRK